MTKRNWFPLVGVLALALGLTLDEIGWGLPSLVSWAPDEITPTIVYFGKLAKLEIPYTFWTVAALGLYLRAFRHWPGRTALHLLVPLVSYGFFVAGVRVRARVASAFVGEPPGDRRESRPGVPLIHTNLARINPEIHVFRRTPAAGAELRRQRPSLQ